MNNTSTTTTTTCVELSNVNGNGEQLETIIDNHTIMTATDDDGGGGTGISSCFTEFDTNETDILMTMESITSKTNTEVSPLNDNNDDFNYIDLDDQPLTDNDVPIYLNLNLFGDCGNGDNNDTGKIMVDDPIESFNIADINLSNCYGVGGSNSGVGNDYLDFSGYNGGAHLTAGNNCGFIIPTETVEQKPQPPPPKTLKKKEKPTKTNTNNTKEFELNIKDIQKLNIFTSVTKNIIVRKPIATRESKIKQTIVQSPLTKPTMIKSDETTDSQNLEKLFSIIDNTRIDVPLLNLQRSKIRQRKQTLKCTTNVDSDLEFIFDKAFMMRKKDSPIKTIESKKLNVNNSTSLMIGRSSKRLLNKIKNYDNSDEDEDDSDHYHVNNVATSDDIGGDDGNSDKSTIKCLRCLKIFKTSRSLVIHQKNCKILSPPTLTPTLLPPPSLPSLSKQQKQSKIIEILIEKCDPNETKVVMAQKKRLKVKQETTVMKTSIPVVASSSTSNSTTVTMDLDELSCNICKKSFRTKNHLIVHQKGHTTNSFKCNFCAKIFRLKSSCDSHSKKCCKLNK